MNPVITVASKEFKDGLRNRWIIAITLMFAVFSVGLSFFGSVASGTVGFMSLPVTITSLASLAVFIIPLIALMLAYDAIVGEDEAGTLLLLLTYPLSRFQLLMGKFLGHGLILAVSTVIGFGSSAVIILALAPQVPFGEVLMHFSAFILSSLLLGWVFVAMAYLVSVSVSEKSKAAGLSLVIWFLFVLVFDLALLAFLVSYQGDLNEATLSYFLLLNPTDVFRLFNFIGFEDQNVAVGVMALAKSVQPSIALLLLTLVAWIIAPLLVAYRLFSKRDV